MELVHWQPQNVNILLVDDKQRNLDVLALVLNNPDYNLVTALSGAAAIEILNKETFAVVLLDVMMPDMDGFETAQRIRSCVACSDTPIIFVSAVADEMNFIYRGYRSGAVDYIVKPLDPFVVQAKVAVFAELFRRRALLEFQLNESRALCRRLESEKSIECKSKEEMIAQVRAFNTAIENTIKPKEPAQSQKFSLFTPYRR